MVQQQTTPVAATCVNTIILVTRLPYFFKDTTQQEMNNNVKVNVNVNLVPYRMENALQNFP